MSSSCAFQHLFIMPSFCMLHCQAASSKQMLSIQFCLLPDALEVRYLLCQHIAGDACSVPQHVHHERTRIYTSSASQADDVDQRQPCRGKMASCLLTLRSAM